MSYDLQVWTRQDPAQQSDLLAKAGFTSTGSSHWQHNAKSWLIAVNLSPVEDEDIPDDIFSRLRGLRFVSEISVQPGTAPAKALTLARRIARDLASAADGIWQDPQTGKMGRAKGVAAPEPRPQTTPTSPNPPKGLLARLFGKLRPQVPVPPPAPVIAAPVIADRSVTLLAMHWCLAGQDLLTRPGITAFLDLLARHLPEAVPRRYGPHEPPAFRYAEQGRGHFIDHYLADRQTVIYPTRPALGLYLPVAPPHHGLISGRFPAFAPVQVRIDLDAAMLDDPATAAHLPKAFRAISHALQPFYGEARLLSGYEAGKGGPVWVTRRAEVSPIAGQWWRGIPRQAAVARVIGAPYLDLWMRGPGWQDEAGLRFAMPPVWTRSPADLPVPDPIAQPLRRADQHDAPHALPPVFPFVPPPEKSL